MKPENAIEVNNITKKFKVYLDKGKTIKERVLFKKRRTYEERSVLKGISFEVKKGEAIGLIGHNGCGKSTTLKLLTKIMYPDSGNIEMRGRVSSLIELGAGFHPDMSGRQNIYTNASIFGLTRKEIDSRINDIIAFSELEEFIDNPVRTYSSGMYMRLAFSVAINVDADILLIDEILAVGDANFQAKCFNKLREIKAAGTTIVIVSHSLGQIEQICERSIWIHDGKIQMEGSPRDTHPEYLKFMGEKRQETIIKEEEKKLADNSNFDEKHENEKKKSVDKKEKDLDRFGNGKILINNVYTYDNNDEKRSAFLTGDTIKIKIEYKVNDSVEDACFGLAIFRSDGIHCYGTNTRVERFQKYRITKDGYIIIEFVNELLPGEYFLDVAIESEPGIYADYCKKICSYVSYADKEDIGISRLKHKWYGECFD